MKQQVSPVVAAVAILVVIGLAAFAWMKFAGGAGSLAGEKPPGMPAEAASQIGQYMAGSGKTAPAGATPSGPALVMPGSTGMTGPGAGIPGGPIPGGPMPMAGGGTTAPGR